MIDPTGEKRTFEFTRVCDGKEHPLEGIGVPPDTVETSNAQTLSGTSKRAGGPTSEMQISFSPDGKTHTLKVKRTMPDGKKLEESWVYDRQ